ncbi:CCR4-NOT transcription complex subunit 4 [Pelomyxa schiedti]|nr:CCR4-NOT transcription complex subunit 4 [Pelomyxa schiedti]
MMRNNKHNSRPQHHQQQQRALASPAVTAAVASGTNTSSSAPQGAAATAVPDPVHQHDGGWGCGGGGREHDDVRHQREWDWDWERGAEAAQQEQIARARGGPARAAAAAAGTRGVGQVLPPVRGTIGLYRDVHVLLDKNNEGATSERPLSPLPGAPARNGKTKNKKKKKKANPSPIYSDSVSPQSAVSHPTSPMPLPAQEGYLLLADPSAWMAQKLEMEHLRIIQKDLVYVANVPCPEPTTTTEEYAQHLKKTEYFGQYGTILKLVIDMKSASSTASLPSLAPAFNTCKCFISFLNEAEAQECIRSVDGSWLGGKLLRAAFGTTKYCRHFVQAHLTSSPCPPCSCSYLHALIPANSQTFTQTGNSSNGEKQHHFADSILPRVTYNESGTNVLQSPTVKFEDIDRAWWVPYDKALGFPPSAPPTLGTHVLYDPLSPPHSSAMPESSETEAAEPHPTTPVQQNYYNPNKRNQGRVYYQQHHNNTINPHHNIYYCYNQTQPPPCNSGAYTWQQHLQLQQQQQVPQYYPQQPIYYSHSGYCQVYQRPHNTFPHTRNNNCPVNE